MAQDKIYSDRLSTVPSFTFGEQVVEVFDDMISRSVPLYTEVGNTTVALATRFSQSNTTIYDLGCSTGTTLLQLAKVLRDDTVSLVGIDSSEAMISECKNRILEQSLENRIRVEHTDLLSTSFAKSSVIIANYTLQFLPKEHRSELCARVAHSLIPGGIMVLSEKIRHPHTELDAVLRDLHHDFKRRNGYSDLEIAQKRQAIENVLVPLTIEENMQMLRKAGFDVIYPVLTWYTFVTLVGIKL